MGAWTWRRKSDAEWRGMRFQPHMIRNFGSAKYVLRIGTPARDVPAPDCGSACADHKGTCRGSLRIMPTAMSTIRAALSPTNAS
jgi:hypothetical protein